MFRFIQILLAISLLIPAPLWAAVAFDLATTHSAGTVSSASFSHTTSGSNRYLLACIGNRSANAATGVTYNSVSMTQLASVVLGGIIAELYGLVAPASGANTLQVNYGGTTSDVSVAAYSFTGVHQTSPTGTVQSTSTSSETTLSLNVNISASGLAADCLTIGATSHTIIVGAGQTQRFNFATADSESFGSTEGGSGTVTMSASWTNSHYAGYAAVPLEPAPAAGARRPIAPVFFP